MNENNIWRFSDNIWRFAGYNSSEYADSIFSFDSDFFYIIPFKISSFWKKVTENKKVTVKPLADAFSVSSENSASEGKKIGPEDIKDEKMLAAVAAAVIDAAGEIDNAYIKVRSIREVNQ